MTVHKKPRIAAIAMALALCLFSQPAANAASGFSDVPKNAWFYQNVTELAAAGVVNGYPDGSFRPGGSVTTAEALKLILLAAGYSQQAGNSSHWAAGYASLATSTGMLLPDEVRNLDASASRLMIAKLTAQSLGLSQSAAESPFADARSGWATALYEKGIMIGSTESGQRLLLPANDIKRSEISAIVWRARNYRAQRTTETFAFWGRNIEVLDGVARNNYTPSAFSTDENGRVHYNGSGVTTRHGIDVSQWQGDIDWKKVKASGVDFAILRVGGRYYGKNSSGIYSDTTFVQNIQGATAAGIDVGVYFFSTAVTPAEAVEEANYVLDKIKGYTIKMPVVYDWEVNSTEYRNYGLDAATLNACANAFTARVQAAGYTPMIYYNNNIGYFSYDLRRLPDCPRWLAEYHTTTPNIPTFYYDFAMWQYSDKGKVDGISGGVDLDIQFIRK